MIFRFLENENEMVKKDNQNKKRITRFFMNLAVNVDRLTGFFSVGYHFGYPVILF